MEGGTISARHQLAAVLFVALSATVLCATEPALPGTRPLSMSKPLDVVMVDGINRFCLRELAAFFEKRRAAWNVDLSTEDRLETRLAPKRDRFQKIIGAVDPRLTASKESRHEFELLARLDRSRRVCPWDAYPQTARCPAAGGTAGAAPCRGCRL